MDPRVNSLVEQQRPNPIKRQTLHDPSVTYIACGTSGHKTRACKNLGHGLFLHKLITNASNRLLCQEVTDKYAVTNKPRDGKCSPKQTL